METEDAVVQAFEDKVPLEALHRRFLLLFIRSEGPSLGQVVEDEAKSSVEVENGRVGPVSCEFDAIKDGSDLASHGNVDPVGGGIGQD